MSPLRSDNISGKIIFNFAFGAPPTLVRTKSFHLLSQTARLLESPTGAFIAAQPQGRSKRIFTEGVVTASAAAGSLRGNEPSQALRASSPEGRAKGVTGVLLASPFGRGGCDHREQTERAPPLPCGELPPQPVGSSASKSPCPCRAEHAAFASQTGLRFKSPTGAFMPSGHRRPFWFSFGRQKRTFPAVLHIYILFNHPAA